MSRRLTPGRVGDRGAASVAQTVIVAPVLLFVLMLIVQVGLYLHARNIAENAAQQGASAGRRFDGTEAQAASNASAYLTSVRGTLIDTDIVVRRDATTVAVTITGRVVNLVPGVRLHVEETSSGPVEQFVATSLPRGRSTP